MRLASGSATARPRERGTGHGRCPYRPVRLARGGDCGKAVHGSQRELGVSVSDKMGEVLVALEVLDRSLRAGPSHILLRSGSLHASLIESGQESSSYSKRGPLLLDPRTIPSETCETLDAEMRSLPTQV
jgi:hypothetical protein